MISYYCIVNMPGCPVREIAAVDAADDDAARAELTRLGDHWPGFESIVLYQGERLVSVLANPSSGLASTPLEIQDQAA